MRRSGLSPIKNFLCYGGMPQEEFRRVIPAMQSDNYQKLIFMTIITALFLTADLLAKYLFAREHLNVFVHLFSIFVNIVILTVVWLSGKKDGRFLSAMVCLYSFNLIALGIIVNTILIHDERAVAYFVYIMVAPSMFTIIPVKMIVMIALSDLIFMGMVLCYKTERMIPYDIANALIFGGVSIIMTCFLLKIKFDNFHLQDTLQRIAMTDQLTRLKNRNCFDLKLPEYTHLAQSSLDCIYVDVNGLHELNDTQGHAAGDQMLSRIAGVLQDTFGENDTYRIGGDEFVVFAIDVDEDVVKNHVEKAIRKIEDYGYHVACGWARQIKGLGDINTLICSAEEKMYESKRNYYNQLGVDRRGRKSRTISG